jgi:hypothetical protein
LERDGVPVDLATFVEETLNVFPESASRLIEEYRRSVYLAAIAQVSIAPPSLVGEVWRLHANTPDYDGKFTRETLQRSVPYVPGAAEDAAYFYPDGPSARTLTLYREEFGDVPPPQVWSDPLRHQERARRYSDMSKIGLLLCGGVMLFAIVHTLSTDRDSLMSIPIVMLVCLLALLTIPRFCSLFDQGVRVIRRGEKADGEDG